jgi:hypothetical protein
MWFDYKWCNFDWGKHRTSRVIRGNSQISCAEWKPVQKLILQRDRVETAGGNVRVSIMWENCVELSQVRVQALWQGCSEGKDGLRFTHSPTPTHMHTHTHVHTHTHTHTLTNLGLTESFPKDNDLFFYWLWEMATWCVEWSGAKDFLCRGQCCRGCYCFDFMACRLHCCSLCLATEPRQQFPLRMASYGFPFYTVSPLGDTNSVGRKRECLLYYMKEASGRCIFQY